jgi:hypothetical protein
LVVGVALLLAGLAGGCAGQIGEMPTWVAFAEENVESGNDVGIVVLKVAPSAEVLLAVGRIEHNGWRSTGRQSRVWLAAQDGFVVARVSPVQDETTYAVIQVRPDQPAGAKDEVALTYETAFWSVAPGGAAVAAGATDEATARPAYRPTGEVRLPVLKAAAGRVVFAGTIRIDAVREPDAAEAPRKVGITPAVAADDLEVVRRFMAQHYPKVTARIVASPLQMMRRNEPAD